jgi:hypothetical protein
MELARGGNKRRSMQSQTNEKEDESSEKVGHRDVGGGRELLLLRLNRYHVDV